MADYIEKECSCTGIPIWDTEDGNYTNGSCSINPPSTDTSDRWVWLIDKWRCMNGYEKTKLFMPIIHIIRLDNISRENEDEYVADQIAEFAYNNCRLVNKILYQLNRNDIPVYTVIFDPIDIEMVPDEAIKAEIKSFGLRLGLIEKKGQYEKY